MVVQQERQRRIDTALGVFGVWLRDTFIRDNFGKVAHRDLWQRWADHIGKDAEDKTIGGQQSRAVGTQVRKVYGIAPTRFWLAGETAYGWQGIRLATDADLVCFAPLSGGTTCGQPLNAAGQCDVADTHADGGASATGDVGGDSGPAPSTTSQPQPVHPLSVAIRTRRDALMATKTPDGRMVSAAESKAATALDMLLDVGPDDILTPWHVSQLEDADRLVLGIEATAVAFPIGEWADWRSVLHEAAVMIEEDAQQRKPDPAALQGRVSGRLALTGDVGGDSGPAPSTTSQPQPVHPLSVAIRTRRDALMATKTPGRPAAHGVGRRGESGDGARHAPGRRARRHSDAVARLPAGRRGQARAGHRGNGGRLPNRRVGRLAVGSARSGRDDRGGRAAAEAQPRRAAGPRLGPFGTHPAENGTGGRMNGHDEDQHDTAACDDPTCTWCAAHGAGYAAGKDKTHEELRGGSWRLHVACCGCESCRTVKLIAAGRIS